MTHGGPGANRTIRFAWKGLVASGHGLQPVRFFMRLGPAVLDEMLSQLSHCVATSGVL